MDENTVHQYLKIKSTNMIEESEGPDIKDEKYFRETIAQMKDDHMI